MTSITDLPAQESIADADLLLVHVTGAADSNDRKITFEDLVATLVRQGGGASLGSVQIETLTADAAQFIAAKFGASGQNILRVLRGTSEIEVSTLSADDGSTHTISVQSAAPGDHVSLSFSSALPDGLQVQAWVSGSNTVSVRFYNGTGDSISGATYSASVVVTGF